MEPLCRHCGKNESLDNDPWCEKCLRQFELMAASRAKVQGHRPERLQITLTAHVAEGRNGQERMDPVCAACSFVSARTQACDGRCQPRSGAMASHPSSYPDYLT